MTTPQPPSPTATPAVEESSDLKALLEQLQRVWKHRMLILAIAAGTVALVALWTIRQPKIYRATASVEFDPTPPRPLGNNVQGVEDDAPSIWGDREYYNTQYVVIASQRVAEGVVRQLGLHHDADFLGVPEAQRRSFRSVSVTDAAGVLRGRLLVTGIKDSRLVNISIEDTNARRAQLLANTVATVYVRQNLENKLSATTSALEWLGQQLDSLRGQLESSEMALYEFRRQNNLLSVSYEDRRNLVGNRVEKLSGGLSDAQQHRIAIEARVAELRRAANATDPLTQQAPELIQSPILQALRVQYEAARRNRDSLAGRYGAGSMQMVAAEAALTEIGDAIRHEVRNVLGAAEAEQRTARRVESQLTTALAETQREGLELNLREIQYGRLQRERENNAKLYGVVLERTKETDLTRLLRVNNMRILDDALLPGAPVKPRVFLNLLLGLFAGVVFGTFVAVVLVNSDRSVRSQSDVEDILHATFLGVVPSIERRGSRMGYRYIYGNSDRDTTPITNPDLVVHTHPTSAVAEACRVIRTNLLFMSPDKPFQSLMITSGSAREGKTVVSLSLSIALAQSGKRVLLIDTDLRRPRVHKAFGLRPAVGITSVLVQEASLDESVVETEVPNLFLLACGPIPPNPAELLHSHRFRDLLEEAKSKFDRVIFDSPPIGAVTDGLVIAPQVDGAILVVRAGKTARTQAKAILGQMRAIGGRLAGVVLNDVNLSQVGGSSYYYAGSYEYQSTRETA